MTGSVTGSNDHTQYQVEVEQRWGKRAYARSNAWWSGLSKAERQTWQVQVEQLQRDWLAAAGAEGVAPTSPEAHALARRHVDWLRGIPGTPAAEPGGDLEGYVRGLAEMYVADERFAANYGGADGASYVRDALLVFLGDSSTPCVAD